MHSSRSPPGKCFYDPGDTGRRTARTGGPPNRTRGRGPGVACSGTRPRRSGSRAETGPPVQRELKLIGKRIDEALEELDRFLDGALVSGHDEVRIVHGHGTGRLKSAVRRFLDSHGQVARRLPQGERRQQDREGHRQEGGGRDKTSLDPLYRTTGQPARV
mgnify:CR=1 FL=1